MTNSSPLSKEIKKKLRADLFQQLEGFALVSTCTALGNRDIFDSFKIGQKVSLAELCQQHDANEGYLNVALRILCSQGWMTQEIVKSGEDRFYELTNEGKDWLPLKDTYQKAFRFYPIGIKMNDLIVNGFSPDELDTFELSLLKVENKWKLHKLEGNESLKNQMMTHMNGIVLGPILVALGMANLIGEDKLNIDGRHGAHWPILLDFFRNISWITATGDNFTPLGKFYMKRAAAYGVTVSYLRTFINLEDLIFEKGDLLWDKDLDGPEIHVDRKMNVWGSGGAHDTYFKKLDEVVIEIFNKPIQDQPKGIADMGCGNGALLEHLYHTIVNETTRGKMLEEHPLLVIGSDFNQAAIDVTRENLAKANIHAHVHFGDIGDPDSLAKTLQEKHNIHLGDMLNVRSFLDHNRVYVQPQDDQHKEDSLSTGAFAFRGRRIPNGELEQNLLLHMLSWKPYVKKHGLLIIELHTIAPKKTCENKGKTAVIAYDSTHGYTDQFIVEHDVFIEIAKKAGLSRNGKISSQFPNKELTTVSINLLSEN